MRGPRGVYRKRTDPYGANSCHIHVPFIYSNLTEDQIKVHVQVLFIKEVLEKFVPLGKWFVGVFAIFKLSLKLFLICLSKFAQTPQISNIFI